MKVINIIKKINKNNVTIAVLVVMIMYMLTRNKKEGFVVSDNGIERFGFNCLRTGNPQYPHVCSIKNGKDERIIKCRPQTSNREITCVDALYENWEYKIPINLATSGFLQSTLTIDPTNIVRASVTVPPPPPTVPVRPPTYTPLGTPVPPPTVSPNGGFPSLRPPSTVSPNGFPSLRP